MIAQPFAFALAPARVYQRLTWLAVAGLLAALLITMPPIALPERTAPLSPPIATSDAPARLSPAPAAPATKLPAGLGPVLNATLAADDAQEYRVTALASSPDALHADNPAQRFATTFGADGVQIAPAVGAAFSLRATAIMTDAGSIALTAVSPLIAASRVEYRRDGLTEWYINGPRGLEQGFTLAAPPVVSAQFAVTLAVTGDAPTLAADGALLIGDLRYGDLTVTDAAGATLPAHLEMAGGAIQIAVDARGAQWPVTIDPLTSQATLTAQTPPGDSTATFGRSSAIATANGTTTVVVGATDEFVSGKDGQGAAYVFTGSGGVYTQRARLIASDGSRQKDFGDSVAITISGGTTTIVVGTLNAEEVYVYTGSGGAYTEQARLVSPDPNPSNNDGFGNSVAAATNGGTTIIAVGAYGHNVGANQAQGSVYMFAGSGASYPLQTELNAPDPSTTLSFGQSVALVSNGGTNTLAVGVPDRYSFSPAFHTFGGVTIFTGSGTTYSAVDLSAVFAYQPGVDHYVGSAVAVGVLNGVTTVAASDTGNSASVYLFTGSGMSYTTTTLTDAGGYTSDQFGRSVAVGYTYSQTLVAVGAPLKSDSNGYQVGGVLLFTQTGATYTESSLPRATVIFGDYYGASVAMQATPNSDPIVIAGATGNTNGGATGTATVSSWSAQASVQATFGDGAQTVASPANAYSGVPFHLVARVVDGNGVAIPPTAVTFTVNPNGSTGGLFNPNDATTTTLHTTTRDGTGGTTAGRTDTISLYPSSTSGTFTVSATADGTALGATYTLKIIPSAPVPTLNAVKSLRTGGAATSGVARDAAMAGQPAGLSPAMVVIDTSKTYEIHVTGTGFLPQALGTHGVYKHGSDAAYQMDTVYNSATDLSVYVPGGTLFPGLIADTTAQITVFNPPSHAGGTDGGTSNALTLALAVRQSAPAGSALACSGATNFLVPPGTLVVAPPCQVVDGQGHPVPSVLTGTATGFVGSPGGELVGPSGGTLVSDSGGTLVSDSGGTVISTDGAGVISNDGGSLVATRGGNVVHNGAATTQSAPVRTVAHPATGDYLASTDANGIIMAPPVLSNGIPGTYSRSLSVDGIAQPATYTITNLNPHDGHPATITGLSRTSAHTGDPAFVLTATGTGFVSGSVLSYGGVQLTTTFISATQVSATVPANLLKYQGALGVTVINPDPNGGASMPTTFTVTVYVAPLPPVQPSGSPKAGTGPSPLPRPEPPGTTGGPPPNPLPTGR